MHTHTHARAHAHTPQSQQMFVKTKTFFLYEVPSNRTPISHTLRPIGRLCFLGWYHLRNYAPFLERQEKDVPHRASMDFDPDSMACVKARREFMHLRDCQQVWSLTLLPDACRSIE